MLAGNDSLIMILGVTLASNVSLIMMLGVTLQSRPLEPTPMFWLSIRCSPEVEGGGVFAPEPLLGVRTYVLLLGQLAVVGQVTVVGQVVIRVVNISPHRHHYRRRHVQCHRRHCQRHHRH